MSKAIAIPECNKDIRGMREDLSLSPNERKEGAISLISRFLRVDAKGKRNNSLESPTNTESLTTYYGVYIPCEIKKGPDEDKNILHVYENKSEALELVRRYKQARFKGFKSRKDAISFALRGAEPTDTTDGNDSSVTGEKPYPFKAPSPQDMVALRKAIEAGMLASVRDRVWDNPRYLISSGNTPTILQEGSRYNALHVAAKALNADICNLILTTVGHPGFVHKLYGADADLDSCKEFASILVDRYLNTPDKAMNETPLHFAAKYGAEAAVRVLASFPQCDRAAVNKFGEQPKDIICKRASGGGGPEAARRILQALSARYYVPVLHAEDGSDAPTVGLPFTPGSRPELNNDPLSPRYEIRAFAGPMEVGEAEHFRRRWRSRPRRAPGSGPLAPPALRLREMAKGLESVGRDLADEMKVGWKEYWPFLDTFTDLRSPEGLALLETYLKEKYEIACSFAYSDSCLRAQPSDELSLSGISLGSTSQHTPVKETQMSPITELCHAMKTCTIATHRPTHWSKTDPARQRLCRQPSAKTLSNPPDGDAPPPNHTVSQLLCIERTCQVFAKRIADALNFSLTAEPEVAGDSLKSEAKHLQHTIFTYMDDERFQKIDFALIHSRLAQLVVFKLKQQTNEADDIKSLIEFLERLRCANDDVYSSDDEKKSSWYSRGTTRVRLAHVIDAHVKCLASFICEVLTEETEMRGPSVSETECRDIWDRAAKCRCDWRIDVFERNSKKNASFRKNRSILSTSPKGESWARRLVFDHDIGDGRLQRGAGGAEGAGAGRGANSPAGDGALYTIDVAKCQVIDAEISEDESCGSHASDDEDVFVTASEDSDTDDVMEDASDVAPAEPFIYGEEPTKMDRLVFDALGQLEISAERYPSVYRWRHTVALHSRADRDSWPPAPIGDDSTTTGASWCASPGVLVGAAVLRCSTPTVGAGVLRCSTPTGGTRVLRCSTPTGVAKGEERGVPLQVSEWLRVTGPDSPRAAARRPHNGSFGLYN